MTQMKPPPENPGRFKVRIWNTLEMVLEIRTKCVCDIPMEWLSNAWSAWYALMPFALFFGALALVTKRETVMQDARRALPEASTNLAIFLFDTLLVLPYVALPSIWLASKFGSPAFLQAFWSNLPVWGACLAAVAIGDYVGYWRHRFEHSRLLWPAHATHHSDREMNWFSLNRMHPLNRLTTVTIDSTILALLGLPVWAILANGLVRNAWGYFIHADLRWTLGPLGTCLISPSAHRWHHARDEALAGRNFATVFTFWDKAHGTYQPSLTACTQDTGVEGHTGGFIFEIVHPAVAGWQGLGMMLRSSETVRSGADDIQAQELCESSDGLGSEQLSN